MVNCDLFRDITNYNDSFALLSKKKSSLKSAFKI